MEKRYYPQLDETVFWNVLPNGLNIAVVPRPGTTKKLCYFVTDFGAIHQKFSIDGVPYTVPAGIAHYLEHKLFDMPDRDVTEEFAMLGAIPNAFTSYDITAYYFSCTENFEKSLRLLLEFVSTPYFTEETVAKEQGIIGQEIDMTADNPDSQIFQMLMQAMYKDHPVNVPILGTRESIAEITPEKLALCHRAFYRPDNMLLCVVGDVDAESVSAIAEELLPESPREKVLVTRSWPEEMRPVTPLVTAKMDVADPMFQLGFKYEPLDKGEAAVRREVVAELACEALFGESSRLYLALYERGLIDSSFGGGFDTIEGMAMLTAGSTSTESDGPTLVRDAIVKAARHIVEKGITEKDFLRMKRSAIGMRIRALDSFESTCFRLCAYHLSDFDYFRFPAVYEAVQVEEVLEFLNTAVTEDRMSLAIIYPNEQEETPC